MCPVQFLGKVGLVNKVGMDELEVTLVFTVKGGGFHVIPAALKKVCNDCARLQWNL